MRYPPHTSNPSCSCICHLPADRGGAHAPATPNKFELITHTEAWCAEWARTTGWHQLKAHELTDTLTKMGMAGSHGTKEEMIPRLVGAGKRYFIDGPRGEERQERDEEEGDEEPDDDDAGQQPE